jgi:quercetin dioxygenase-like cupin family protein
MEAASSQTEMSHLIPAEILTLPKVEVPIAGVTGYCLQNDEKQLVFFLFEEGVTAPDHSHCAQSGIVIHGEVTIDIDGQTELFQAGDVYYIPEGVRHRAWFSKPTFLIDLYDSPDRYTVRR